MTPDQFTDLIAGMVSQQAMHKLFGRARNVREAVGRVQDIRPQVIERTKQFLADVDRIVMERAT